MKNKGSVVTSFKGSTNDLVLFVYRRGHGTCLWLSTRNNLIFESVIL